ncbi:hypothetical protein ACLB1Q_18470 [Escherichia coli]
MMKVLIVESEFLHQDTWVGNAVERLADALSQQNVTVINSPPLMMVLPFSLQTKPLTA